MSLFNPLLPFIGCCLGICHCVAAEPTKRTVSTEVVTSNQFPFSGVKNVSSLDGSFTLDVQILNLDIVSVVELNLSDGLPVEPKSARLMVEQRIAQMGRSHLDAKLRAAYQPLGTMMTYALDRYPVIIFDRQAVIYGVTNMEEALNRYRQWIDKDQSGGEE